MQLPYRTAAKRDCRKEYLITILTSHLNTYHLHIEPLLHLHNDWKFRSEIITLQCSTGVFYKETEKNLFRKPWLHLTSNNSVKNTMITAVSCLIESLTVF